MIIVEYFQYVHIGVDSMLCKALNIFLILLIVRNNLLHTHLHLKYILTKQ